MSKTSALLAKARTHLATKSYSYPLCLDRELADEIRTCYSAMQTAADAAAMSTYGDEIGAPRRRTIGDRIGVADQAIADLRQRVAELYDEARANDDLIVLRFAPPAEAVAHPKGLAGWYRERHEAVAEDAGVRDADKARVFTEALVADSYARAEDGAGVEIVTEDGEGTATGPYTWEDACRELLDSTDLDRIEAGVVDMYRGGGAVPFDPASFGRPQQN